MYPSVPAAVTKTRRATARPRLCARYQRSPCRCASGTEPPSARDVHLASDRRVADGFEPAVTAAVAEVERQPDDEPHGEPRPVGPAETVDHRAADQDSGGGDERHRRHPERALEIRPLLPHDPHAGADQDEG